MAQPSYLAVPRRPRLARALVAWLTIAVLLCPTMGDALLAQTPTPEGRVLARYDFTTSAQGWRISGDTDPMPSLHHPTGGQDGGCIEGTDQALGETWYFAAPPETLALLPSAVDGTLSYWLKQSGDVISLNDDDIVIMSKAGRLSYRFPTAPGTNWTPMSVRLSASAGWVWNWNRPATQAQIAEVLASPTRLEIRGEYVTGDDHASLDTVLLLAAPRP